ncbi:hypothetical protein Hanom_Chr00s000001g01598151 [Helianthus anomalus]
MSEISNRVFVTMNLKNRVDFDSILVLISRTLGLYFADFSTFFLNLDALELRKGQKTCEFRLLGFRAESDLEIRVWISYFCLRVFGQRG